MTAHDPSPDSIAPPPSADATAYAYYRLPDEGLRVRAITRPRVHTFHRLPDSLPHAGFLIAPFQSNPLTPIIYMEGEEREERKEMKDKREERKDKRDGRKEIKDKGKETGEGFGGEGGCAFPPCAKEREAYHTQFRTFHDAILRGEADKLVLARRTTEPLPAGANPLRLFLRACRAFPHCFVALYHTPQTGTWLTATPEVLLEQAGGQAHTMALAGTMPAPANEDTGQPWSAKNRREQQYVADYIRQRLQPLATGIRETPARTCVAGNVMHLRSDFTFTLRPGHTLAEAVATLHPTPAVCGVPTDTARRFILAHEAAPRAYYSGFCGPVAIPDSLRPNPAQAPLQPASTRLYVMLRCMHILDGQAHLYAGGGLVAGSTEDDEWNETEAKLYAMRITKQTTYDRN